ncbi:hypothetical protein [Streptosporangium sp. NPDC000239]|uniref:Ig-like domain-containing protein n=1 Tax=Streptosporangium jomthongense TaxID=1193683 RepID=A0ABV8ES82_9ACTN
MSFKRFAVTAAAAVLAAPPMAVAAAFSDPLPEFVCATARWWDGGSLTWSGRPTPFLDANGCDGPGPVNGPARIAVTSWGYVFVCRVTMAGVGQPNVTGYDCEFAG